MELTKNTSSRSQLSYKLEQKVVKGLTLIGKKTQRKTLNKLSRTYHVTMFFFFLFHLFASIKILDSISE